MIATLPTDPPGHPEAAPPAPPAASRWSWITPFAAAVAISGILLRLIQFFYNRSLYIDEAALALNVRDRPFLELLDPLQWGQTAPIAFMWLQKALLVVFGDGEMVLRAIPLLAGILSVPLFMLVARRALPVHLRTPAIAIFAFSPYPIHWASDAKPYSVDLAVCLILILLMLRFEEKEDAERTRVLGLSGALSVYFSHAATLILAGLALRVAWLGLRGRMKHAVLVAVLWMLGLPAVWQATSGLGPENAAYFRAFWSQGFLPMPWAPGALDAWKMVISRNIYDPLGFRLHGSTIVAGTLIAGGIAWFAVKRRSVGWVLVLPALATVLASMAGRYPLTARWEYSGRLVLFLTPVFCFFLVAGLAWLPLRRIAASGAAVLALLMALTAVIDTPHSRGDIRPMLDYVQQNARDGDIIYMYYGTRQVADWYRRPLPGRIVQGICAQMSREQYLDDLERLRGAPRVWLVLGYDFYDERRLLFGYMDNNARLIQATDSLHNAWARLYDFSGDRHVPAAPDLLKSLAEPDPGTGCRGIFPASTP